MTNRNKLMKKMQKLQALEDGRRQFCALIRPQMKVYVWVNSVSLPVAMSR